MAGPEDGVEAALTLDLRGLRCPLPVLKTAKRLAAMRPGERLAVLSDDPLAVLDLPAFCAQEKQGVVSRHRDGRTFRILIERGPDAPSISAA
jgi:tRNA 2-thiouridine synthesizing protein A